MNSNDGWKIKRGVFDVIVNDAFWQGILNSKFFIRKQQQQHQQQQKQYQHYQNTNQNLFLLAWDLKERLDSIFGIAWRHPNSMFRSRVFNLAISPTCPLLNSG